MTRMGPGPSGPQRAEPQTSNIYTVLIIIATVFAAMAAVYVGYRTFELFGTILPPAGG
jgi:hypothetical protein